MQISKLLRARFRKTMSGSRAILFERLGPQDHIELQIERRWCDVSIDVT